MAAWVHSLSGGGVLDGWMKFWKYIGLPRAGVRGR